MSLQYETSFEAQKKLGGVTNHRFGEGVSNENLLRGDS